MEVWQLQCSRVRRNLYSYIKGDIKGLEEYMMKEHLEGCTSCKAEYEKIKSIQSILSGIGKRTEAPQELSFAIMNAIDLDIYKASGIYVLNNLKNWGISLIATGLIIAAINISPAIDISPNQSITTSKIAKIQDSIIRPIKVLNQSIVDIADWISDVSITIMEDNSSQGDE